MKLKLLHLYDDVMNLYGEYANVAVLARCLTDLGCDVSVQTLSLYESKDIRDFDFYYMGAGTERGQKLVLSQLAAYRDVLASACEAGKLMLFTGNSLALLGKSITDADGRSYEALHLAEFQTTEGKRRITGDCIAAFAQSPAPVVGFVNKCSKTTGVSEPLFTLKMGFGNEEERAAEGFRKNNCFATHLIGPLLVKNPALLRCFAALLGAPEPERLRYPNMEKAYETTLCELQKRLQAMK